MHQPLRLTRSPLVMVLAQVKFSAVAAISKYVPDIQEQLRHKGFPRYVKGEVQEVRFEPGGPPKVSVGEQYQFHDRDGHSSIVVTTDFIVLQTNKYVTYERFEQQLRTVLEIIHAVVNLNLVERLGLRYVNWIRLGPEDELKTYLQSGLLGLNEEQFGAKKMLTRFEFVGQTEVGKIVIKYSGQNQQGAHFLPPDLAPTLLNYDLEPESGKPVHLLDLDHFSEGRFDFDVDRVLNGMGQLHHNLELAFHHAVTREALIKWGSEEPTI